MNSLNEKIDQLNQLLILNNLTEKVYLEALEASDSEELKQFFRARAFERNEFCRYIGAEISMLGGKPEYKYRIDSSIKINWPDFKKILASNNPRALFSEMNRIKTVCIAKYNKVLNNCEFPENLVTLLKEQTRIIGNSISYMRYKDSLTNKNFAVSSGM